VLHRLDEVRDRKRRLDRKAARAAELVDCPGGTGVTARWPVRVTPSLRPRRLARSVPSREEVPMPTGRVARDDVRKELKEIGRKLEDVGRKLATATGRSVKNAADETLDMADGALTAARKSLAKLRAEMKKRG
jgi:hypothetical protein